jgi:hypothetical protein
VLNMLAGMTSDLHAGSGYAGLLERLAEGGVRPGPVR